MAFDGRLEKRQAVRQLHGFNEVVASETKYIGPGDYFHPYFMPEMSAGAGEYLTDRLMVKPSTLSNETGNAPSFVPRTILCIQTWRQSRTFYESTSVNPVLAKSRTTSARP